MDNLRGIKFCDSLKYSFFTNFSRGEQKHFFFGRFTRHKTLPRVKNGNFRAQVTIIADSRFFFWSVYVAHFESLYNNWRLSVIAKIIVQWNEVRLLNRPKKVSAISDSQILFFLDNIFAIIIIFGLPYPDFGIKRRYRQIASILSKPSKFQQSDYSKAEYPS